MPCKARSVNRPLRMPLPRSRDCPWPSVKDTSSQKDRRLEAISQEGDNTLMNFTTLTYYGPGRIKSGEESRSFELEDDEFHGNETAMLYDAQRHYLFLEAGQGGMAAGATARYSAGFVGRSAAYDMIPVPGPDAAARARRCRQFRKLEMRVALGQVGELDRQAGLGANAAFSEELGAGVVDISVNVGPARPGSLLPECVRALFDRIGRDGDAVKKMQVSAGENDGDPLEVIDLLQHRERREHVLGVDPESRKVPIDDRWAALRDIHADYCNNVA